MGKVAVCPQLSLSAVPVSSINGAGTALQSCSHEWVSMWNYTIWGLLWKKIDMIVNVKEIQSWKGAHERQLQPRPTFPHGKSSYYIYFKPGEGRAVASFMSLCHWACAWLYFPSPADTSAGRLARRTCFVCSLRDDHGRGSEGSAQPPECAQRLQNQISARGKKKKPQGTPSLGPRGNSLTVWSLS